MKPVTKKAKLFKVKFTPDFLRRFDKLSAKVKNQPPDLTAGEFNRSE